MQIFKLAAIASLMIVAAETAHARNSTPYGYLQPAAQSLGNNSEFSAKKAKNFIDKKARKEPRWKQRQRGKNKKPSGAISGVNE